MILLTVNGNPHRLSVDPETPLLWVLREQLGLTAALKSSVTVEKGRVQEANFDGFPLLRMDEMPAVEVYIADSRRPLSGIGEVGVPPISPAVTNAIFAATGKRVRRLPVERNFLAGSKRATA